MYYESKSLIDMEKTINKELSKLYLPAKRYRLSLNLDKTHFIIFQPYNKPLKKQITINVIHNYRTRSNFNIEFNSHSKKLFIPSARTTNYGLKQLTVSGPKIWNNLPYWIENNRSLNIFLENLKVHLLANY